MDILHMAVMAGALILLLFIGVNKKTRPLHGETSFQKERDMGKTGLMENDGIVVGKIGNRYLQFGGTQHVSLIAPTRSGKGVGVAMPNAFAFKDSLVAFDIKEELFNQTSKYRESCGQKVFKLAFFSKQTHRYNPLFYVSDDPMMRVIEVMNIGYILYPKASGNTDPMWSDNARDLWLGIALFLIEDDKYEASIPEVYRHSSGLGVPLVEHLKKILAQGSYSEACTNALQRFINTPEVTRGGILANFTSPLSIFSSPIVDAATSGNDFDLRKLREEKMTVYVCIPPNKINEAGILTKLFFSQLLNLNTNEIAGTSDKSKYKCLLMMDEVATLGYMPMIAKASGHIAGYGIRLLLIAQSSGQLAKPVSEGGYGHDGSKEIMDNMALNIAFRPKDLKDAKEYSEVLGYETVKSKSIQIKSWGKGTESDQRRAMLLPQEMMRLDGGKCILFLDKDGIRPILAEKICYYSDPVFVKRMKSVSPMLKNLGRNIPTEEQLRDAWSSGELSSSVPVQDIEVHTAKRQNRTRKITEKDVSNGLKAESIELDLDSLPSHKGVMKDTEIKAFADAFVALTNKGKEHGR